MDISSLSISIPVVIALAGLAISLATYFGNKKRQSKSETEAEVKKHEDLEARLTGMEKDIQYIRIMVDKIDKKYDNHETRLRTLEAECQRRKK